MPTVPWIRLYQNWPRHRKTMALRRALGTAEPILCLWLWAAENAPNGDLSGMTVEEIEEAACWQKKSGKAVAAMVDSGFIDTTPEGGMRLHNWCDRAGAGIENLEKRRERAKERMRSVRANKAETGSANTGANNAGTLLLSLDQSRSGSSPLAADPDQSNPHAKSAHDWLRYFQATYWSTIGRMYGQGSSDAKSVANLADLLETLPPQQRVEDWNDRERIVGEFLKRDDVRTVRAGHPFAFFVTDFRGLAMPLAKRPRPQGGPAVGFHDPSKTTHPVGYQKL